MPPSAIVLNALRLSRTGTAPAADAASAAGAESGAMHRRSYAVWWEDGDGARRTGRLEIGPLHALFSGNGNGSLALALDQITGIEYSRGRALVHRNGGATLNIGNLDAPGALCECANRLARALVGELWR
jgi:hypothetical protein